MTERDFTDRLLPAGPMREPLSALARADAIVLPTGFAANHPALRQKPVWRIERQIALSNVPPAPIVFCGIARPKQFFAQLRAAGIAPAAEVEFRDHHPYTQSDIERLLAMRGKLGAGGFLTTEKDAVNLLSSSSLADLSPLAIANLNLTIDRPAEVMDAIFATIHERKPRS
jgi:tetraacyldisaccharide 4'-kinase